MQPLDNFRKPKQLPVTAKGVDYDSALYYNEGYIFRVAVQSSQRATILENVNRLVNN